MKILVRPSRLFGRVSAPPSKSYTHRAYASALLSNGVSRIINPLRSGDTEATLRACRMLGGEVVEKDDSVILRGGSFKLPDDVIDAENSGTTLRFFTAISALAPEGYVILTGDDSLRRRPMQPLLDALKLIGVDSWSSRLNGFAPIIVRAGGIPGGEADIRGDISSQFISALLLASVRSRKGVRLRISGDLVSRPYIDSTITVMNRFRFNVVNQDYRLFEVDGMQVGRSTEFRVPGDFSSISFILAGSLLTDGDVLAENLDTRLPQADSRIIHLLRVLGAMVKADNDVVRVIGSGRIEGGEFDLRDSPDLLPVLSAIGAKSVEGVVIKGVGHAKYKESDRIGMMALELGKLGVDVEPRPDGLVVKGRKRIRGGVELDPHGDHRLFMALSILSMATEKGCIVRDAELAEISYPGFLKDLKMLGAVIETVDRA